MSGPIRFPELIEPQVHKQAAIHWLVTNEHSMSQALELWERVALVRASIDEGDYFWFGHGLFRVLNPEEFGVSTEWANTMPLAFEAEPPAADPWCITQPDVEPAEVNLPPMEFMSDAELGEEPKLPRWMRVTAALGWLAVAGTAVVLLALAWTRTGQ